MATPTTTQEQSLDLLLNPAQAGSIEQTIKVFPDESKLDKDKTQGRHHRLLLTTLLTRTKAWVKALYATQNYAGPYRAGIVTAGDVHYTKGTENLYIWRALQDFVASAAPVAGAQWELYAVQPIILTEQDLSDLETRLQALELAMLSDDPSLDTLQEIVTYIKANRDAIATMGGVLDSLLEFCDELDGRLQVTEQAVATLQQVVQSNDPALSTLQQIVDYIKAKVPDPKYWGGLIRSSTDSQTIEQYFASLLPPVQDLAYQTLGTGAVTVNYKTSPNYRGPAAGITSITVAKNADNTSTIPSGADLRLELTGCTGQTITLPAGQKDITGADLPEITLPGTAAAPVDCFVLVNNTGAYLKWSVTGMGEEAFDIASLPDLPAPIVDTDFFAISRGGVMYKATGTQAKVYFGATNTAEVTNAKATPTGSTTANISYTTPTF